MVNGPWYAKAQWMGHPRTILVDRCYYRGDPDHVSVGWMRPDGGRDFVIGEGRTQPLIKTRPSGGSIFLADYDGPVEAADTVRLHPARDEPRESLTAALRRHRVAVGYQTTALVTAALEGLHTVCKDSRSIMADPYWLQKLPYADWHYDEISDGDLWEHLRLSLSQR